MKLTVLLFTPADNERKLAKGYEAGADALILDLEDSVLPVRKQAARDIVLSFLASRPRLARKMQLYVRVNAIRTEDFMKDIAAIARGNPDGVILPKCESSDDVTFASACLDALEERDGVARRSIKILALAGETPAGLLALPSYAHSRASLARLMGLSWGPWDLAREIAAFDNSDAQGRLGVDYQLAMSLILFAAKAAGVMAIDAPHTNVKDSPGLLASCQAARRRGWNGKMAIHPDQVSVIREGFAPSPEEITRAERVIAAMAAAQSGVATLDGVMIDQPHLAQAQAILADSVYRGSGKRQDVG